MPISDAYVIRVKRGDYDPQILRKRQKIKQAYFMQMLRSEGEPPDRKMIPCEFRSGSWFVQRSGKEVVFSVLEKNGTKIEIVRRLSTTAGLNGIHI